MQYTFEYDEIICCGECPLYSEDFGCCMLDKHNLHLKELTFKGEGRPEFCKLTEKEMDELLGLNE